MAKFKRRNYHKFADGSVRVGGKIISGGGTISLQEKTVTENGEVTADNGYDGLSKITVNVPTLQMPLYYWYNGSAGMPCAYTKTTSLSTNLIVFVSRSSYSSSVALFKSLNNAGYITSYTDTTITVSVNGTSYTYTRDSNGDIVS